MHDNDQAEMLGEAVAPQEQASRGVSSAKRWLITTSEGRLFALMGGAVVIAIVFSGIGLWLYNVSGTAQLDLSRPGYEGVSKDLERDKKSQPTLKEYSAAGPVDEAALKEFDTLYSDQLNAMKKVDAFGGDPMSLDGLGLSEDSVTNRAVE